MNRINFTSGQHIESGWERATTRWDSRGGMREGTESGVGLIPQEPKASVFAGSIYGPPGNNAGSGLETRMLFLEYSSRSGVFVRRCAAKGFPPF